MLQTLYIVQRTSFQLQTKNPAHCTKYAEQCTMHNAHCTLYNVHCTMHAAPKTMHNAQCTLHIARCTIHEGLKCNSISNTAVTYFTLIRVSFSFFRVEAIIRPLHFSVNYTVIHYFHVGIFFSKGSITKSFSHLAS